MMLSKHAEEEILKSKDYIFEPKIDGYRAFCIKEKDKLKIISRNGNDITADFPEFKFLKNIKAKQCKLDGEIIIYDEKGNPSFEMMQNRSQYHHSAVFICFDILEKEDKVLTNLPIEERKKILSKTIKENENLQLIPFTDDGEKLWHYIKKRHIEGVMAKKKGSEYLHYRSGDWLKIKRQNTIDCVIVGITQKKREISSLGLGLYDNNNELKFIGKVGTGFSESLLRKLSALLKKDKKINFAPLVGSLPKDFTPVIPENVCEVKFMKVTKDTRLRMPVFLRLRDDKFPRECLLNQLQEN